MNEFVVRMVAAFAVLFGTILSVLSLRTFAEKVAARFVPVGAPFVATALQVATAISGVYWFTRVAQLSDAALLTALATISIALGIGLQGKVAEMLAALTSLLARRFEVGDLVTIGDHMGRVEQVTFFGTILTTLTGDTIYLSNALLDGQAITNHTVDGALQIRVDVPVVGSHDRRQVQNMLRHGTIEYVGLVGPSEVLHQFKPVDGGYMEVYTIVMSIADPADRERAVTLISTRAADRLNELGVMTPGGMM